MSVWLWLCVWSVCWSRHTNNWAVIVDASKYWFNYRHATNALAVYKALKAAGLPDSQIILMLPDDIACSAKNCRKGQVFAGTLGDNDLLPAEVDYRGSEVTPNTFLRVLTDRLGQDTQRSKRLLTDSSSNILIYLTGHGGEDFLKFQDKEILSSRDLADAFEQMRVQKRFNEIFFIADTCQAESMLAKITTQGIFGLGTSKTGQSSYSHTYDPILGNFLSDKFVFFALKKFDDLNHKKIDRVPLVSFVSVV